MIKLYVTSFLVSAELRFTSFPKKQDHKYLFSV